MDGNISSTVSQVKGVGDTGQLLWLDEFTGQLMNVRTAQQALDLTARAALRAVDAHSVTLYRADCDGNLELRHGLNRQGQSILDEPATQLEHLVALIHLAGGPIWITGDESDAAEKLGSFLTQRGVAALIGIPLAHDKSAPMNGILWVRFDTPRQVQSWEVQV